MNPEISAYAVLRTDDATSDEEQVVGVGLVNCILVVLIKDGKIVYAWHCAGMDLFFLLSPDAIMMKHLFRDDAGDRMKCFKQIQEESGEGTKTFAFGRNADDVIAAYFKCKCYRTEISPCDIFVDATCMKAKYVKSKDGEEFGGEGEEFDLI